MPTCRVDALCQPHNCIDVEWSQCAPNCWEYRARPRCFFGGLRRSGQFDDIGFVWRSYGKEPHTRRWPRPARGDKVDAPPAYSTPRCDGLWEVDAAIFRMLEVAKRNPRHFCWLEVGPHQNPIGTLLAGVRTARWASPHAARFAGPWAKGRAVPPDVPGGVEIRSPSTKVKEPRLSRLVAGHHEQRQVRARGLALARSRRRGRWAPPICVD